MGKKYKIRDGFTFVDGADMKIGGDVIELEDDVAANHLHKLEAVEVKQSKAPASKSSESSE